MSGASSAAAVLISAACSVVSAGVLVRHLGAAAYGSWSIVVVALGVILAVDFGVSTSVQRAVARLHETGPAHSENAQLAANTLAYRTTAGVIVLAGTAAALTMPFLLEAPPRGLSAAIVLATVAAATSTATASWPAGAAGRGRFVLVASCAGASSLVALLVLLATIRPLGIAGAGAGLAIGAFLERASLWFLDRPNRLRVRRGTTYELHALARDAIPLLVISVGGQLLALSDLVIVSLVSGTEQSGYYRIGVALPTLLGGAMFRAVDVTFPALVRRQIGTRRLSMLCAALSSCLLTGVALRASDVLAIIFGDSPSRSVNILEIFTAVGAINAVVHVVALAAIAEEQHHWLTPLVATEIGLNAGLSVVLAFVLGPVGPAVATLVTLGFSNLVAFPALVAARAPQLSGTHLPALTAGLAGAAGGTLAGVAGSAAATAWARLAVTGAVLLAAMALVLWCGRQGRWAT